MDTLTRYDRWMQRVMDGALDFSGEHWQDLSNTAQYAAWRQLAQARGANSDLQHHMTRSLLPEVIYAAGGVERELGQLQRALADVQRFADEASVRYPRDPENWPECGVHVSTPSMREASYIFTNLLSWARSTVERTERKDRGQPAGLLPALAPGPLYDSVDAALRDLEAALPDYRRLANYSLHVGAVTGGGSASAELLPDGQVIARVPDVLRSRILTWEAFEFTENREMLTYATKVMDSITTFVDRVIDAFAPTGPQESAAPPSRPQPS